MPITAKRDLISKTAMDRNPTAASQWFRLFLRLRKFQLLFLQCTYRLCCRKIWRLFLRT